MKIPTSRTRVALAILAATSQHYVRAALFTFDGVPSGTPAVVVSHSGVSFSPAAFLPDINAFGEEIPGTAKWRVDVAAPALTVDDPSLFGRGPAPSPNNALNALFQPILMLLPAPTDFGVFSARLDNDPFGDSTLTVNFYDSKDALLASVPADQTIPGFLVTAGPLSGVSKVLFPAGAFYDDISYASVPEVDSRVLVAGLLVVGAVVHLRRRA